MPRHAGSLSISNGLPIFDRLYLTEFKGRLRLAEAQVEWQATTPFSKITAETFISQAAKVLVVHYQDETEEALPRLIELARWGTRGLLHWYSVIKRDVCGSPNLCGKCLLSSLHGSRVLPLRACSIAGLGFLRANP
jgi:hypothetical protein